VVQCSDHNGFDLLRLRVVDEDGDDGFGGAEQEFEEFEKVH
jgi:hypothetical protein